MQILAKAIATWAVGSAVLACPADDGPPKRAFPLGRETTFVDGPLDEEGFVDYAESLNVHYGRGVKPAENFNAHWWKGLGRSNYGQPIPDEYFQMLGVEPPADEGFYFEEFHNQLPDLIRRDADAYERALDRFDTSILRPWTAEEFPEVADWLDDQEEPLRLIAEASRLPKYFRPLFYDTPDNQPRELMDALMPVGLGHSRDVTRALVARAMLRLGEAKYDAAWSDLVVCARIGRHLAAGPTFVDLLIGRNAEWTAADGMERYFATAPLTTDRFHDCLDDLAKLPPQSAAVDKVDRAERFLQLDMLRRIRRGEAGVWEHDVAEGSEPLPEAVAELAKFDFVPVMVELNRRLDRYVAAGRAKTYAARRDQYAALEAERKSAKGRPKSSRIDRRFKVFRVDGRLDATKLALYCVGELTPTLGWIVEHEQVCRQRSDLLKVACALAAYRTAERRYPATLDELAPRYLLLFPLDTYSGEPLRYRRTAEGFVLYAVGADGRDDGGIADDRERENEPYDIVSKVPLEN